MFQMSALEKPRGTNGLQTLSRVNKQVNKRTTVSRAYLRSEKVREWTHVAVDGAVGEFGEALRHEFEVFEHCLPVCGRSGDPTCSRRRREGLVPTRVKPPLGPRRGRTCPGGDGGPWLGSPSQGGWCHVDDECSQ